MGKISGHEPVKLIVGLIGQEELFEKTRKALLKKFGKIDFISPVIAFNFTDYYNAEMGSNLKRQFLSFKKNIVCEDLVPIKHFTNKLEKKFYSPGSRRQVNIDPGYLNLSKLVLATTKDHQHRLYLGKGIFAEVTLRFRHKSFIGWEWTYPDYLSLAYIEIFNHIRNNLFAGKKA